MAIMKHPVPLVLIDDRFRFGGHVGKEKTLASTVRKVLKRPWFSFQLFVCSPRGGSINFDDDDILETAKLIKWYGLYAVIHASYTCNLCGSVNPKDSELENKAGRYVSNLQDQLDMGVCMGDVGVIVHFGSCKDKKMGEENMIRFGSQALTLPGRFTKRIANLLGVKQKDVIKRRRLVLENSAGAGTTIGNDLECIARVYQGIAEHTSVFNVSICIDTAHALTSGMVDFGNIDQQTTFLAEFDELIGLDHLEVFHLNDSKEPSCSRKDCHQNLGRGYVFGSNNVDDGCYNDKLDGLRELVSFCMSRRIPLISETSDSMYDRCVIRSLTCIEK